MTEDMETAKEPMGDITPDDKLWAALGYPIPIVAIIVLLMEEKKARPFIRFHAVQALAFNVIIWAAAMIFSVVTAGLGSCLTPVFWLITLWPAYDSYMGNYTELPVISNFIRNQNWV